MVTGQYSQFFQDLTGHRPYPYQTEVADALFSRQNVVLRAPTGSGKTLAAMVPFLFDSLAPADDGGLPGMGVSRLIYALPLRTLVQEVYKEARQLAEQCCIPVESVTMQTGENPGDPFFDGRIVVTTYDQVLSSLLNRPHGVSYKLRNVNAAHVAGSLVVFDEFHLMEPARGFMTGAACLTLFDGLTLSVWMTATATEPLEKMLIQCLNCRSIPESQEGSKGQISCLPIVTEVKRSLVRENAPMTVKGILDSHVKRTLVVVNTVHRAQDMFDALVQAGARPMLLHSRFFQTDREEKQKCIMCQFSRDGKGGILVATQVIEAGLNISCENLHTELCPANSLVQRAGRCARFQGERGIVHVYPLEPLPGWNLPYDEGLMNVTEAVLPTTPETMDPVFARNLVQAVHGTYDARAIQGGLRRRLNECLERMRSNLVTPGGQAVSDLIRAGSDDVRVIISRQPPESPQVRDGVSVSRGMFRRLLSERAEPQVLAWRWDPADGDEPWKPVASARDADVAYDVCLSPEIVSYSKVHGVRLGMPGDVESPVRVPRLRPGYKSLNREEWSAHARAVVLHARNRVESDFPALALVFFGTRDHRIPGPIVQEAVRACALLHDLGKLQKSWQLWAAACQKAKDPEYVHCVPLAHTDYDPGSKGDKERERVLDVRRPPHAVAGAYYAGLFLPELLPLSTREGYLAEIASACMVAIAAHHGGWVSESPDLGIASLDDGWADQLRVFGLGCDVRNVRAAAVKKDKRKHLNAFLAPSVSPDSFARWWPLVSYLCRNLRLSDQQATAEGGSYE